MPISIRTLIASSLPQNVQGVQGVQGIQGIQGVRGVQGEQGIQGVQGVQGIQGDQGTQGVQGIQGIQGLQGSQGLQGTGAQGAQGAQGANGYIGVDGNQGIQGIQGPSSGGSGIALTDLSVTDDGGDGSLAYDNSTGVFTYVGPSSAEVRSHFTEGTGITLTNGEIATTITQYTDAAARSAVSAGTGINYNSNTGVISTTDPNLLNTGFNEAVRSVAIQSDGKI